MLFKRAYYLFFAITAVLFTGCVNKATKFYNSGMEKFEDEEFDLAAHDLRQAVEFGAPKKQSFYAIAESYRLSNRLHEAEQYYLKAIESGSKKENAHFYYAMAMKSNGNYIGSRSQLKKYLKYGSNNSLRSKAKKEIEAINTIMEIGFRKDFYKIRNFKEINTEAIEYSPVLYNDRTLYFTSSRGEGPIYPGQGTRFTDIFEYKFDGTSPTSGIARKIPEIVNEPRRHESSATFTPDGNTMIFSRSGNGKKNDLIKEVDLFSSTLVKGAWSEPVRLEISDENSWDSNPFISSDGSTLYFSSNRDGGHGSEDIWYATKNSEGIWDNVTNMGKPVNTSGEELFPYIKSNGDFYFSSDGHPGFGQLDIFKLATSKEGKKIIINPGKPLNSTHDDFALIYRDEKTGYFSSNRPDGQGDDDIYLFEYDLEARYVLEGITQGNKVIADTVSDFLEILPHTPVQLLDANLDFVSSTVSGDNGEFEFEVQPEKNYFLRANRDSYETKVKPFSTMGITLTDAQITALNGENFIIEDSIALKPFTKNMVLEFPPIYYAYDKWDITKPSETILDDMAAVMEEHPSILVELGSHTDARGTAKYNENLSQKRAESAVKYILAKGISPTRLTAKGYGEQIPKQLAKDTSGFKAGTVLTHTMLNEIEKKNKKLSEAGHQLNRRTEFKIVGFIEKAIDVNEIEVIDNGSEEEIINQKLIDNEEDIIKKKFGDTEENTTDKIESIEEEGTDFEEEIEDIEIEEPLEQQPIEESVKKAIDKEVEERVNEEENEIIDPFED